MNYQSTKWKAKRDRILRRDKYMCQLSKRYGKMVEAKVVHHIFPSDKYPEYAWCDWNLISISTAMHERCHNRETGGLSPFGLELLERTARTQGIPPVNG